MRSGERGRRNSKTKCLRTCIDINFFPCFVVGNTLLKFMQEF
jgi:hypothetical protein